MNTPEQPKLAIAVGTDFRDRGKAIRRALDSSSRTDRRELHLPSEVYLLAHYLAHLSLRKLRRAMVWTVGHREHNYSCLLLQPTLAHRPQRNSKILKPEDQIIGYLRPSACLECLPLD